MSKISPERTRMNAALYRFEGGMVPLDGDGLVLAHAYRALEDRAEILDKEKTAAFGALVALVRASAADEVAINRMLEVRGSRYRIFNHAGIWDIGTVTIAKED